MLPFRTSPRLPEAGAGRRAGRGQRCLTRLPQPMDLGQTLNLPLTIISTTSEEAPRLRILISILGWQ